MGLKKDIKKLKDFTIFTWINNIDGVCSILFKFAGIEALQTDFVLHEVKDVEVQYLDTRRAYFERRRYFRAAQKPIMTRKGLADAQMCRSGTIFDYQRGCLHHNFPVNP